MFLEINPGVFPILIAVGAIFVPVVILAIICFVKLIVKQCKKMRKPVETTFDYQELFGGKDNIENIAFSGTRVNVTVKDLEKVNMEELKNQAIQALVSGNTIKCQSDVLFQAVKNSK